ncbi:Inner membrane protein yccF [Citrobacter koseri]|nr:Inner membrane protein yccF [Citrobacter koseri]
MLGDYKNFRWLPYGNEAVHVDELNPAGKSTLLNTGGTVLNVFWLIVFGWWLCLMHIASGIAQCHYDHRHSRRHREF